MSFAIVKGEPLKSQLALDRKLDALVAETGRDEDRYSIGRLLFNALRDKPHFINTIECSSGEHITNGELLDKSVRTARALRSGGVSKGDVVMIIGTKHNLLAIPYYASLFSSAAAFHVDENATVQEIHNFVKLVEPKYIFTDANKLESVEQAIRNSDVESEVISFEQHESSRYQDLETFIQKYNADLELYRFPDLERDDTAVLCCSSGSTGAPKAVVLTNYGIISKVPLTVPENSFEDETNPSNKFFILSSCQWISYVLSTNLCTINNITKLQSKKPIDAFHVIEILRKYKPEVVFLGPGIATEVLQSPEYKTGDFSSIRNLISGGAHVSPDLQSQLKKEIHPEGAVLVGCGSTESCGVYSMQTPSSPLESIGQEVNTLEYKIVDENDREVPIGETGELMVRSKGIVCKGYYKDDVSTKDIFTHDGWLRTGDLLYKDDKGHYYFVDRKKLLIKYGSYHIYPLEVEGVICSVEGVAKAGVCWTDNGLVALVETQPGATVTPQQVHHAVNSKLSYYKQLSGGVLFGSLPQTVTGKLDRAALEKTVYKMQNVKFISTI